nr:hypothetical protein [Tanacetum cinerariifolium]
MIAILEKYEHNQDFHQIVDFVEASHKRYALTFNPTVYVSHIRQIWSTARIETTEEGTKILATGEGSGTPTEPHHTPTSEASQSLQHELPSPSLSPVPTESLPTVIPSDNPPLRQYTRRARIAYDSTPRVTSLAADEVSMQQKLDELTALCTSLQRQQSEMVSKFEARELEINRLKARMKLLEDKDGGVAKQSGDDALIKGRSLDKGEKASERVMVPTDSVSIYARSEVVSIASPSIPTAALIFTTATDSIPYTRRKGKEKMVESDTPKKKKLQEQIDVQVARELEKEIARDAQRMNE